MPANIFKNQVPDPNLSRNAFDLSERHVFSCNLGELHPIYSRLVVPGDHFVVNVADMVRARPMVSAPFLRLKQHLDFYFVPYSLMWSQWLNFRSQKDDWQRAGENKHSYHPSVLLSTLRSSAYVNGVVSTTFKDAVGRDFSTGALCILDELGYGSLDFNQVNNTSQSNPVTLTDSVYVSPMRLAAYNAIWYHFYRNKFYDNGGITPYKGSSTSVPTSISNPAYLFNFDDLDCGTLSGSRIASFVDGTYNVSVSTRLKSMLQMRYRQWKKDIYTGVLPSQQFGAVQAFNVSANQVSVQSANGSVNEASRAEFVNGLLSDGNGNSSMNINGIQGFDVFELRRKLALQKFNEISLRAGSRMADNQQAHFGVRPRMNQGLAPQLLGSVSSSLNINDVDSTASTGLENGYVGAVAGKGIMTFDGNLAKFDVNDDGIIMAIYSLLPDAEYNARGVDRDNQLLDRWDFFTPELQNLGMEAVSTLTLDSVGNTNHSILGYAPRFFGYKSAVDKVHGQLQNDPTLFGSLSTWSTPKFDSQYNVPMSNVSTLYVNPFVFDNIFQSDVDIPIVAGENDGTKSSPVWNSQFIVDLFFEVKAVRPMSVLGIPEI